MRQQPYTKLSQLLKGKHIGVAAPVVSVKKNDFLKRRHLWTYFIDPLKNQLVLNKNKFRPGIVNHVKNFPG